MAPLPLYRIHLVEVTYYLTMPDCNSSAGTVKVSLLPVEYESERVEQFSEHDQVYLCAKERKDG